MLARGLERHVQDVLWHLDVRADAGRDDLDEVDGHLASDSTTALASSVPATAMPCPVNRAWPRGVDRAGPAMSRRLLLADPAPARAARQQGCRASRPRPARS